MRPPPRPGQSSLFALIALPVMLGAVVLVLVLVRQRDTGTELRNAAVAAALAAAEELADEALLTDDPDRIRPLFDRATAAAAAIGQKNFVEGKRLVVHPAADGKPGDLEFGYHDPAEDVVGSFRPLPHHPSGRDLGRCDAVRLTAHHPSRDCGFTRVTAVFDRHVCGFRPLPDRPAPLVPVALFDGPDGDDDRPAWGHAVARGSDRWSRGQGAKNWEDHGDGLREVTVRVGWQKKKGDGAVCGFPVVIGGGGRPRLLEQITRGVSAADLHRHGGEFALCDRDHVTHGDPELCQPHEEDEDRDKKGDDKKGDDKKGDGEEDDEGSDLPLRQFRRLARSGDARVWPVFSRFTDDGAVVLAGFTAARVVSAVRESSTGAILLTLQPAVVATPTAVTRPDRKPYDRTVGRVRIAG